MLINTRLTRASLSCLFLCLFLGLAATAAAQASEHHKLLATDGMAEDFFGAAVATNGNLVAVGSPQADHSGTDSGSAYVYTAKTGTQLWELVPTDGAPGDRLGASISVDADRVLVGAPHANGVGSDSGAVYVFDAVSGVELFKLEASDAAGGRQFGTSVAMDGNLAVIGDLGAAYLFDVSTGQELYKFAPMGASTTFGLSGFGESVAIDGSLVVIGARLENGVSGFSGAAYVFDTVSGNQLHRMIALDGTAWANFGASVDLDGSLVVIGAPEASPNGWHSGTAYMFDALTGQQLIKLLPGDGHLQAKYGASVGVDGLQVVIGAEQNNAGGLFSSGAAYLYAANDFSFVTKLVAGDAASLDELGGAISVSRGVIVAGAIRDDDNGNQSGSAYIFDAAGTVTTMDQCLANAGTITHVDGIAVSGSDMVFRLDDAQPGATRSVLMIASAPAAGWPSCGLNLGNAGELLIASPIYFTERTWVGLPADVSVTVPLATGLMGLHFYVQGAFVALSSPVEPVRLTGGLEVVLGGYL